MSCTRARPFLNGNAQVIFFADVLLCELQNPLTKSLAKLLCQLLPLCSPPSSVFPDSESAVAGRPR